jgi:general secretion pathway protein K
MLIVVLWVMGLISVAVGTIALQADQALRLGHIPAGVMQRAALARGAVAHAAALLARDDPAVDHLQEPWATGQEHGAQVFADVAVEGGVFTAALVDEGRKLSLNAAAEPAMRQLAASLNIPGADAAQIAAAMADWRDEPIGAACEGQEPACHNAPFQTVDELRLVPGMTPESFAALEPYVTVFGSGLVNANTASVQVLDAIGCPGAALVAARDAAPWTAPPPACPGSVVTSTAFTVSVDAALTGGSAQAHLRAVVHRDGRILAWQSQ